jgi:hypothetical protein
MRSNALEVEKRWRKTLGENRFDELRDSLVTLHSAEAGEAYANSTRRPAGN